MNNCFAAQSDKQLHKWSTLIWEGKRDSERGGKITRERERGGKGKHVKALQTDKQNGNSYNLPLALSVEAEAKAWACPQRVVGVVVGAVVAIAGAAATGNPQRKSCSGCAFNY